MQFLQEVLKGVHRLDDEPETDDTELDLDVDPSDDQDGDTEEGDDQFDLDGEDFDEQPESGNGMTGAPEQGAPFSAPASGGSAGGTPDGSDLDLDVEDDVGEDHPELDGVASDVEQNPDRQGLIRAVKGAHLVYKRDTEDGSFEELWIYNVDSLRDELKVKKAILAGTDIPINKTTSPDGTQSYDIWSSGNAEMILIRGLPN